MSDWTLLCDFDGTISVEDTTDTLLERFGKPGWEKLEDEWKAGRIGSRECMAGQVALLDMSRAELDKHLTERAIDPGFAAFVAYAKAHGMPIEILSDGLDYAIHFILQHYDFDYLHVTANRLEQIGDRRWRLGFPNSSATCRANSGTCKCTVNAKAQGSRSRVLMIGDGASDFCVAESADFVFAKGKLIDYCRAKNIAHAPIKDFAEALALLPALASGKLAAVSRPPAAPLPNVVSA
ncbi:MAG: MtnX-like HAD-IB family phosphatase [Proteobacteria bacterium]|uniref:MtnX-like HAD-IB family phosphatase n=1 Tax=Rudaea sp. TaxID=2136325 RepID=UPI0032201FE0|nr:MtnX-like HAD-IB family phosphatase [Pseudomonadota bacterium]